LIVTAKLNFDPRLIGEKVSPLSEPSFTSYNAGFKLPAIFALPETCFAGVAAHDARTVTTAAAKEFPRRVMIPTEDTFTNDTLLLENVSKFVSTSRELYCVRAFEYEVPSSNVMLTMGATPVLPTEPDNVAPSGNVTTTDVAKVGVLLTFRKMNPVAVPNAAESSTVPLD